jgi:nucleoside-diphosphate-sugar epimerase
MTIVVTGAAGLVGRRLVARLAVDREVVAIVRTPMPVIPGVRWVSADLASPEFARLLPQRADAAVHLAQSAHHADFPDRAMDVFRVNVAATAVLLDWAVRAGVASFVLASAGGAQRPPPSGRLAYYLGTKRSAELLADAYRAQFRILTLRLHTVYGREQRPAMLMPRLIASVRSGQPIILAGEQGISLTPTHVEDAVDAIVGALRLDDSHTLDVAGPEILSLRAIAECIGRKVRREPVFDVQPRGGAGDVVADLTDMRALIGHSRRTLDAGLDDVLR